MSRRVSEQYSPLRDKRRQSDAKWRASVATCYDALKYVIPNVKNLSKKKISKALILQECEKHIQNLEDTISFLLHIECKNQGQVGLWKEGNHWTHCSMEKLRGDFSEKQHRVFSSSAHGRRCYNLLKDIKEEVFYMTADAKQMIFISEDSLELVNASENLIESSCGSSDVLVFHLPAENVRNIKVSEETAAPAGHSQVAVGISKSLCSRADFPTNEKGVKCLPQARKSFINNVVSTQVKQHTRSRQRLICQAERDNDNALLRGLTDSNRNTSADSHASFCDSLYLLTADSCGNEEKHCVASPATSSFPEVSSSTHISLTVSDISKETSSTSCTIDGGENEQMKLDKFIDSLYILPNESEYTCLLRALEAEKEQVVPCMENTTKTARIKRPRLADFIIDTDCPTGYTVTCESNSQESGCFRQEVAGQNSYTAQDSTDCVSHASGNKISILTSRSDDFSSPIYVNISDIKMEADKSSPCNNYDPMLSSLNMPKFDLDMPLTCLTESDGIVKQQLKHRSARRKLNFNCPSFSGYSHSSSHLLTPNKTTQRSSMMTGFTPVKLPDDLTFISDQDNPLDSLTSPWKTLDSPFNTRIVPQGYIDSNSVVDLEDSLLCLETIDTVDYVGGLGGTEVTPVPTHSEKFQQPEELQKTKGFSVDEPETRVMPKCRRRLEGLYDLEVSSNVRGCLSNESLVAPHMDTTLWTCKSPHCQNHPSNNNMFDLEESLLCLETLDTFELGEDS